MAALATGVFGLMQANYQAKVADNNAQIAQMNANRALEQGGVDAQDSDMRTKALLGAQESQQAASGVSIGGASAIQTRNAARSLGNRDSQSVYSAGLVRNNDYLNQKSNFESDAAAARMSGISSFVGGVLETAAKIVSKGKSGGGNSMLSDASATASPGRFIPVEKPTMLSTYLNPLLRRSHAAQAGF